MTSGIKAVAFDIDGTLYPSWRLYIRIIPYVLKHLRFFLKYSKVRAILHRTAPSGDFYEYQARLLALELGVDNESARNMIEAIVYKGMMPYLKAVKPYAHIRETIQAFKDKGYKLAILSDFPPEQKGTWMISISSSIRKRPWNPCLAPFPIIRSCKTWRMPLPMAAKPTGKRPMRFMSGWCGISTPTRIVLLSRWIPC